MTDHTKLKVEPGIVTGIQLDPAWVVRGRIIPASCTSTLDSSVLRMQVQYKDWLDGHFHVGHCPVQAELAVELAVTLTTPYSNELVFDSMDPEESEDVCYAYMIRLLNPPESLAFITMSGMAVVLNVTGLDELFKAVETCDGCKVAGRAVQGSLKPLEASELIEADDDDDEVSEQGLSAISDEIMEAMMETRGNDKNH